MAKGFSHYCDSWVEIEARKFLDHGDNISLDNLDLALNIGLSPLCHNRGLLISILQFCFENGHFILLGPTLDFTRLLPCRFFL